MYVSKCFPAIPLLASKPRSRFMINMSHGPSYPTHSPDAPPCGSLRILLQVHSSVKASFFLQLAALLVGVFPDFAGNPTGKAITNYMLFVNNRLSGRALMSTKAKGSVEIEFCRILFRISQTRRLACPLFPEKRSITSPFVFLLVLSSLVNASLFLSCLVISLSSFFLYQVYM